MYDYEDEDDDELFPLDLPETEQTVSYLVSQFFIEADRKEKVAALSPFSVTDSLMAATEKDSIFMHCLPAHRGEEVSASVIDGPRSVIWREAYHRRTTIQALLYHLSRGELAGSK
mgnify:CR=1 FL=1